VASELMSKYLLQRIFLSLNCIPYREKILTNKYSDLNDLHFGLQESMQWVDVSGTLYIHIREVLGSNLHRKRNVVTEIFDVFLSPCRQMPD
jgi:hypothetical protein